MANGKELRILFMGTPDFAAASLEYLIQNGYTIVGLVCRADKPKNRGMQIMPPPCKLVAGAAGLPIYQPETLKDGSFQSVLDETQPDLIVTVAYGRLLPQYVLDYPKYGCINLHGSLLPKYRGAAPIQRAVMNGDAVTGVTTMFLSLAMDEGDMLLKKETPIGPDETAGELMDRLAVLGAPVLAETIDKIADGTVVRTPQNHAEATYAAMLDKAEGRMDFSKSAQSLYCIYRGLTPALSVSSTFRGKSVKITAMHPADEAFAGAAGEIVRADKNGIVVSCGEGALVVTELAPEGKRAMAAADFINGRQVKTGEFFGV